MGVITLIGYAMFCLFINKFTCADVIEAQEVETIWTVLPAVILLFLAFPSLRFLYLEFDSYIISSGDLIEGQFRLLEVDHRIVLPIGAEIRIMVTSADVIHA